MPTIRELRVARGLSQETLAARAGISFQTMRRVEQGKPVTRDTVDKVAKTLGISPNAVTGVVILNRVQDRGAQ